MYNKNEPETIQNMFGSIAEDYDRANLVLSFGLHKYWNETLVREIGPKRKVLDLCAGTGDIAKAFLNIFPGTEITLVDFCPEMLEIAKKKVSGGEFIVGDAQKIPLPDASKEAITIAYGIRNVKQPLVAFQECYRVLQPGGVLGILELTRPDKKAFKLSHHLYLKTLLPILGKFVAKDKKAYSYLAQSVRNFSSPVELEKELLSVGFRSVHKRILTFGTVTLLIAHKPSH
jgi:demethylmenaquinone methyltransferase/2-methoxy-6-polyprenyl-1,4-benzoquinol methylase